MKLHKNDRTGLLFNGTEGYLQIRKNGLVRVKSSRRDENLVQITIEIPRVDPFCPLQAREYENPRYEECMAEVRNDKVWCREQRKWSRPIYRKTI